VVSLRERSAGPEVPRYLPSYKNLDQNPRASWTLAGNYSAFELVDEFGDDVEEVVDDRVVGDVHDRRVGVRVDRDDRIGALHAGDVLDCAGDTDGDVDVGRDDLPGLADLSVLGQPAVVDDRARGRQRRTECVRQIADQVEVLLFFDPAADRDEEFGLADVDVAAADLFEAADRRADGVLVDVGVEGLDRGVAGAFGRPGAIRRSGS